MIFEFERGSVLEAEPPRVPGDSVNDELLNAVLRRQIVIANMQDELALRVHRLYRRAEREIAAQIRDAAAAGVSAQVLAAQVRRRLRGSIRAIVAELRQEVAKAFDDVLSELWLAETATVHQVLAQAIPDEVFLQVGVVSRPPLFPIETGATRVLGQSLGRWGERAAVTVLDALAAELTVGMSQGEDMRQLIARTARVFGAHGQRAEATARTAVQTLSAESHARLYEGNRDIVKGVQYTATFDRRTCPVCANLDSSTYFFADGTYETRPRIPIHMRCRCVYTPITRSWRELGILTDDLPPGPRASMDGVVPGRLTFADFLRRSPRSVAVEILGRERARLFFEQGLELGDFVHERVHRAIPLDDLRRRLERAARRRGR